MNEEAMAEHKRYLWKEIYAVTQLHRELASLYLTKSNDRKRINMLWRAIEEREGLLFLEGVLVA